VGTNLVRVFSNPLSSDSDNDGVSDDLEEAACGNPGSDFTVKAGPDQQVTCNDSVTLTTFIRGTESPTASYIWHLLSGPDVRDDIGLSRDLIGKSPVFTASDKVSFMYTEQNSKMLYRHRVSSCLYMFSKNLQNTSGVAGWSMIYFGCNVPNATMTSGRF
jgi:hypothetical protein